MAKNKENKFSVLDIGTEAVKVLICKEDNNKIIILGASTQYFERYGVFDGKDFETDLIKKAILKAIERAYQNFIFFSEKEDRKKRRQAWKRWPVLVGLPSNILKGRIDWQFFKRERPARLKISKAEEKNIHQQVFKEIREKISQKFAGEFGILPKDIQWITSKVLEVKIDGYSVPKLQGYEGKDLGFKILVTFLPKYYFENMKRIFKDLELKILKIVHVVENLPAVFEPKEKNGIFLDIGGEVSQIFLAKNGQLQQVNEFEKGGKFFSQRLADTLGIDEESARSLKERYSNKLLSAETTKRIKEIFLKERETWYESLKLKMKKINLIDSTVFLFGGGSLLPEIQEVFQEKGIADLQDLSMSNSPKINFIYPNNLKDIKDATKSLTSPKDVPSLILSLGVNKL